MFLYKCVTCITITLSLISCGAGKQLDYPGWYEKPAPVDTSKLRFDGYYTNTSEFDYRQINYTAVDPVFFTTRNKIHVTHGARTKNDSALFTCKYYKKLDPAGMGAYFIEGDKITAFAPVTVAIKGGALYPVFNLYFTGTIVNKELITNWKAVPPFPKKINKRVVENSMNAGVFSAHDLKFIRADSIKCLNP
jgi:hypothetical protein